MRGGRVSFWPDLVATSTSKAGGQGTCMRARATVGGGDELRYGVWWGGLSERRGKVSGREKGMRKKKMVE